MQATTLKTVDADGQSHAFTVQAPLIQQPCATFRIGPKDSSTDIQFELTLDISERIARVVLMNNQGEAVYARKGIPEAAILHAAAALNTSVRSNTATMDTPEGNAREPAATKVWERLVAQGKARYEAEQDIYQTT